MPVISTFYGITICMFHEPAKWHPPPPASRPPEHSKILLKKKDQIILAVGMFRNDIKRMFNRLFDKPEVFRHMPHIHVIYKEYTATIGLYEDLVEGEIPLSKKNMVKVWMNIHNDELKANWELARDNKPVFRIEPLR